MAEKIVVACKDFTSYDKVFIQFAELKNSQIDARIYTFPTSALKEDNKKIINGRYEKILKLAYK